MKKINMENWVMSDHGVKDSRLTVLKEVEPYITKQGIKQIQYLCKCSCGNEVIVKGANLRSGNTKSCGCISKEQIIKRNIESGTIIKEGDVFGKLTVIKDLGMRKQNSRNKNARWSLCQCECGSDPIEVPNNLLKIGHKKSCGCLSSVGELEIEKILQENNIFYVKEYKFSNLINPYTKYQYRFDFAIFDNDNLLFLIEFDGRQHYDGPEADWAHTRTLKEIRAADEIKNAYCIKNNIILKRIPYFNISQITLENILSNKWNIN